MVFGRQLIVVVVCKKKKEKKPHPAWVFLRKMPEKQSILFAWPNGGREAGHTQCLVPLQKVMFLVKTKPNTLLN